MNALHGAAFLLAAGGGATARYLISHLAQRRAARRWPLGTVAVNVAGALLAGAVAGLVVHHGLGEAMSRTLAVGFLGSFTTFSTLTYETVRLAEEGEWYLATANLLGSSISGVVVAAVGFAVVAAW